MENLKIVTRAWTQAKLHKHLQIVNIYKYDHTQHSKVAAEWQ